MATESEEYDNGGALRISGIAALASMTRDDWTGETLDADPYAQGAQGKPLRARTTCPACAAECAADDELCWNCGRAFV